MRYVAIVHYNTPALTEALVQSIRNVGCDWPIVILDNSDKYPFTRRIKGVKTLNNRKQQLIDFDKEIARYPNRCDGKTYNGINVSVKHMMSVQYLFDALPEGFILMDSDILVSKPFDFLWDERYAAAGHVEWTMARRGDPDRLKPYLCYLNVPLLKAHGAKYYDPTRCWGLASSDDMALENRYDTGASLLEDIRKKKPLLRCRNWQYLEDGYVHYGSASYHKTDLSQQAAWLKQYENLWMRDKS